MTLLNMLLIIHNFSLLSRLFLRNFEEICVVLHISCRNKGINGEFVPYRRKNAVENDTIRTFWLVVGLDCVYMVF